MIQDTLSTLEKQLKSSIEYQTKAYIRAKESTLRKMLGEGNSTYDLFQHFKYQSTIGTVLKEMENSYLEYFGKPWDYVEPVTEEPVQEKPKRGRKPKAK
jgi:hypothetical protein